MFACSVTVHFTSSHVPYPGSNPLEGGLLRSRGDTLSDFAVAAEINTDVYMIRTSSWKMVFDVSALYLSIFILVCCYCLLSIRK